MNPFSNYVVNATLEMVEEFLAEGFDPARIPTDIVALLAEGGIDVDAILNQSEGTY